MNQKEKEKEEEDSTHWKYAKYVDHLENNFEIDKLKNENSIKYDCPEALSYVTPFLQAKNMVEWIFKSVYSSKIPIRILDTCGGIGGNAIGFLRHQNVSEMDIIELNSKRYECLNHNLDCFHEIFFPKKSFHVHNIDFFEYWKKRNAEGKFAVFCDPPWQTLDCNDDYKKKY